MICLAAQRDVSAASGSTASPAASSASKPLSGKVTFKRESSVWLCRLLHVKSMTSYVEQGQNTYNGMKEPPRNSYHQLYMGQVHRSGLPRNPAAASWNRLAYPTHSKNSLQREGLSRCNRTGRQRFSKHKCE